MNHPAIPLFLALSLVATLARGGDSVPAASELSFSPCQIQDSVHVNAVAAECASLRVAEDRSDSLGPYIHLHIARIAAISRRKRPDPLFVLAGGPGMAASTFYASVAFAFERIHRDRDIVLVDQRGTGLSNALTCALDDTELYRDTDAQIVAEARRCLTALSSKARVQFYTTSIAVQDLDQVRAALGYDVINLYGVSYGTRVAQHYLRRFPRRTRSVILDGVVPPQRILGPAVALNAERALARILERCAQESQCHAHFGDPATSYHALRDTLQKRPVSVQLADPTSGAPTHFEFTRYHFATVLRLASYTAEQAALLPLLLHQADSSADFVPIAAQFLLVNHSYADAVAYGMHNSVVCSEDVPFYDLAAIDRAELEKTYLGTTQLDGLRGLCAIWPRGPVDPDFHAPLHSDAPVLLLSGSDDPITPPADAEQAKIGLPHSLHIVLRGFGHGQLTAPCLERVMSTFIAGATVKGLDTSCTREDKPMPFFTTLGGPPP